MSSRVLSPTAFVDTTSSPSPTIFTRRADFKAFLDTTDVAMPVFCIEPSDASPAQNFLVASFPYLIDLVRRGAANARRCRAHEMLRGHVKLFFDIERTTTDANERARVKKHMDALVFLLQLHVRRKLADEHQMPGVPEPLVLDGSRDAKQSRHVIFDVVFENAAHVHAFVHDLLHVDLHDTLDENARAMIDVGVYSQERSLRAPYCTGFGKDGSFFSLHGESFDEAIMWRGLITAVVSLRDATTDDTKTSSRFSPHVLRFDYAPLVRDLSASSAKRTRWASSFTTSSTLGWSADELAIVTTRVSHELTTRGLSPQYVHVSPNGLEINAYVRGEPCPMKGDTHRSHHAYFHLRLPHRPPPLRRTEYEDLEDLPPRPFMWRILAHARFCCPDKVSCPKTYWYGGDWSFLFTDILSSSSS